jgi:hypothetical protein
LVRAVIFEFVTKIIRVIQPRGPFISG